MLKLSSLCGRFLAHLWECIVTYSSFISFGKSIQRHEKATERELIVDAGVTGGRRADGANHLHSGDCRYGKRSKRPRRCSPERDGSLSANLWRFTAGLWSPVRSRRASSGHSGGHEHFHGSDGDCHYHAQPHRPDCRQRPSGCGHRRRRGYGAYPAA